jgi:peptidoglycan/xylan/chitin deacetylase (PgdA/CDA1 family)
VTLKPIPDGLVVLTFDDGSKSDLYYVAPQLERYGFSVTFFINNAGGVEEGREGDYLSWEEVRRLHERGFEIGNHGRSHPNFAALSRAEALAEIVWVEEQCGAHGVPRPRTLGYPGGHHDRKTVAILQERDYLFARRGDYPEFPLIPGGARGRAYDPERDHPLLIPSALISGPNWELEDVKWAAAQAREGKITIITFHGVPDIHPHCSIDPDRFTTYLNYLHERDCTVIALRDLVDYVDPARQPEDPYASIAERFGVMPTGLACDFADNPLGIDRTAPSLSWVIESSRRGQMQSAYQILAASSKDRLDRDEADLWDSGKVASEKSVGVTYDGVPLKSGEVCWWKVRCWNRPGKDGRYATPKFYNSEVIELMAREQAGSYSAPASFEMGLLELTEWEGEWIGADPVISSPLLRKGLDVAKDVSRARVYVCSLGYYELYINGERLGDHVLDPAPTNYSDEDGEFSDRALYVTYDVTDALQVGSNIIGVMLGNGWYSADVTPMSRTVFGEGPRLQLQLNVDFADGDRLTVASDAT